MQTQVHLQMADGLETISPLAPEYILCAEMGTTLWEQGSFYVWTVGSGIMTHPHALLQTVSTSYSSTDLYI